MIPSRRLMAISMILAAACPAACDEATPTAETTMPASPAKMTTQTGSLELTDGTTTPLLTLTNGQLSVQFVPALGGKIVSIKDAAGREYLSRSDRPYAPREYGMDFGKTEFDGIDECFPTMGACKYPFAPWEGAEMVDHGELFATAWKVLEGPGVDMQCEGTRFGYVFRRRATLEGRTLTLRYTATNTSDAPLHYMYLFHPLFAADAGSGLVIPDAMRIRISYNHQNFLAEHGTIKPWGELTDAEGQPFKNDQFRPHSERYYKYHSEKLDAAELLLRHADGAGVRMTWSKDVLPYFAVWTSEGSIGGLHHFAPEPSNASVDDLAAAAEIGQDNIIPPRGTAEWTIKMDFLPARQ